MAKKTINAFNGGEVSPYSYARSDDPRYSISCLKMQNFVPLSYGGAERRPAFKAIPTEVNYANDSILKDFVYNEDNAYLLRFNQYLVEIWLNDVKVYELETPYLASALPELKFTQSNDIMFIAHKDYPVQVLKRLDENTFTIEEIEYVLPPMLDTITEGVTINPTSTSGISTLNSENNFFDDGHLNAYLLLEQFRDNKNGSISTTIDSSENCVTDSMNVSFCTYRVETSGKNWQGKVIIEKSIDGGKIFNPELTMVDNTAQTINDTSAQASTYYDHTFATDKEEGANTFIRVRFIPNAAGANDPVIKVYPSSPYIKGLFKITQIVSPTQAKGNWLSPIQDVVSDYTNTSWSATTTYPVGTKLKSVGSLSLDSAFPDGSGSATQAINTSATSEVNMTADAIDLTYDYVNNAIYILNSAGKVNKYDYNRSTGAITFNSTRTFTYADGTGQGTNATGISYFGIGYYNHPTYGSGICLISLDRVSAKKIYSQVNHIATWDKDDGGSGAAVTGTISSGTDGTIANRVYRNKQSPEYFRVYNIHGLSINNGRAYWRQHRIHGSGDLVQRSIRVSSDISTTSTTGKNTSMQVISDKSGDETKTTYGTDVSQSGSAFASAKPNNYTLMQEPYFSRHIIDSIYVDGYLLCLNDVENRIDFRLTDYTLLENVNITNATAMPPASGSPESLHGLCAIPKIVTLRTTSLKIGSQYEIISLGGTGSNQSNESGQAHWNTVAGTVGVTYSVGDTFTCSNNGADLHPNADGTVILHYNENLDNIRMEETDIILLSRGTDNASGVLKRLTTSGDFNYYEASYEKESAATFKEDLDSGVWSLRFPNITRITESAFSTYRGYPRAIAIHENRLCLAGTKSHPNRMWLSVTNDLNNFTVGEEDTASLDLTMNSLTQDEIQWLVSARELVIGTSQNEWSLGSGSNRLPITPLRFNLKRRTQYGSSYLQGQLVDSSVLFFMRQRERLREWILQDNQEDYIAADLSLLAEHITEGGIIQMAIQRQPETIIWMVRADGYLIGLTYNKETETFAWHKHNMLQADVKSIAVLPNASNEDDVYVEYEQTYGVQQNNNYLAKMDKRRWGTDHVTEYSGLDKYWMRTGFTGRYVGVVFPATMAYSNTTKLITVDCSSAHNLITGDVIEISDVQSSAGAGDPTNYSSGVDPNGTYSVTVVDSDTFTYTGDGTGTGDESYTNETGSTIRTRHLIHLAGATLIKKVDGVGGSTTTVVVDSNGRVDLGSTQSNKTIVLGNSIISTLAPLYLDVVTEQGSTKGQKKAIQKATIRFKDTYSAQVGQTETTTDLDDVRFGSTSLNTEDAEVWLSNANEFLQTVYVIQRNPQPCTVLAMIPNVRVL